MYGEERVIITEIVSEISVITIFRLQVHIEGLRRNTFGKEETG